ncbi:hypothetical protein AAG906_016534 [Vitis piasezkii]
MMGRAQKQKGQERVRWSPDENKRLAEYMERHGETSSWKNVPTRAGLSRSPKSCRLRWNSKLKPGINQKPFSEEEEATIIELQKQHGNKDEVRKLHSDASFAWNPRHGHGFHPTDEELLTSPSPLPPQTPRTQMGSVLGQRVFQMQVPFLRRFQPHWSPPRPIK